MAHDRSGCQVTPARPGVRPLRPAQVGAADSTGLHLEYQVIGTGLRLSDLFYRKRNPGFCEHRCFHGQSVVAMKLNNIAIAELVLSADLLSCKLAPAPEPGKLEGLCNILVHQLGNVEHTGTLPDGEGAVQIS